MAEIESLDIEVVDVTKMIISADPAQGAVITPRSVAGQGIDLHLPPLALAKLEAFLARASTEQSKHQTIH